MPQKSETIHIVGGGLAGTECALQLANKGYHVLLHEMRRGSASTPAHKTQNLAELVCSNSFGSMGEASATGELKFEARQAGCFVLQAAEVAQVPAGQALGVDRDVFSQWLTDKVMSHPNITVSSQIIESLDQVPRPAVIATGPLTHERLAQSLQLHFGSDFLYFFDAIAPIIDADSINMKVAWKANRYDDGDGDYINCPLTKQQYFDFIEQVKQARKIEPKDFEKDTPYFEGCMPIEAMVERGPMTLAFGPMKPVGLIDPVSGRRPYAVVQLRQDNKAGTAYNMVGFQTKMAYGEQSRIFKMIPGLENAEFLKLGSIHRNLYINSLKLLRPDLSSRHDDQLYFAGQITGVEGYFESTCTGLMVSRFIDDKLSGRNVQLPPRASAFGSLLHAITLEEKKHFQPTNINFSLFPPLDSKVPKDEKKKLMIQSARNAFSSWISSST